MEGIWREETCWILPDWVRIREGESKALEAKQACREKESIKHTRKGWSENDYGERTKLGGRTNLG